MKQSTNLNDPKYENIRTKFFEILSFSSLSRFSSSTNLDFEVETLPTENFGEIFSNWMAIILISHDDFKITFNFHYEEKQIAKLTKAGTTGKSSEGDIIKSWCKEQSNLIGGMIKEKLLTELKNIWITLPLITRGYHSLYYEKSVLNASEQNFYLPWKIKNADFEFQFSAIINVFSANKLDSILPINVSDDESDDEDIFL